MPILKNLIPHSHDSQDDSGHTHPIADGKFSQKNFTQAKSDKLNNIQANAEVNVNADWNATSGDAEILNKPTDVTDLSGHNADELSDISSAGSGQIITSTERSKLTGVATGATQNDTDANLKNRSNHTGEQAISTVTGLQTALDGKVDDSQVLTNVPSNAVFTDTTYIVADNQLSQKNFTTALHAKLTGVEAGATADQTASEIKTAYESNADTNPFTNAEQSKLSGVDASANNYTLPAASGSLGGIVSGSGGDVTVDGSGVVTVLDDSHNHVVSNVDGLQAALDAKVDDSQVLTNVPANAVFTDTTYNNATTSSSGLLSSSDKSKLDSLTGAEVNVNADWNATSGDAEILNKPTTITSAEQAKLGHLSVTQAVDLDTMESDIATNNAKVTNATHTGDVTGSTALTIANDSVTNAKMANVATGTVKGRTAAGVGDVEDLDIDTDLKSALNLSKTDVGLSNVENKSSATIRGEIVDSDIPASIARDTELTTLNASNLTSGTVSADRLPFTESGKSAVGNFGQFYAHTAYTDFNADVADWGWSFVSGATNAPNITSTGSGQWYRLRCGLGSGYGFQSGSGDYWLELAYPRYNQSTAGCYMRTCHNGTISAWVEIGGGSATTDASDLTSGTLNASRLPLTFTQSHNIDTGGATSILTVKSGSVYSVLRANGNNNGQGVVEVGADNSTGGGMCYNGTSNSTICNSGQNNEEITFYRMSGNTRTAVMAYKKDDSVVDFREGISFGERDIDSYSTAKGMYWHSGTNYAIYREAGAWGSPYPKLNVSFWTGINIGGKNSYGGTRFFNGVPGHSTADQIMSVGDGDDHVRINNSLMVNTNNGVITSAYPAFYIRGNTSTFGCATFTHAKAGCGTNSYIGYGGNADVYFRSGNKDSGRVILQDSGTGKVLIGTSTGSAKLTVNGSVSKTSGSFDIAHPDPEKKDTHRLRHYFVETPSAGGNIYKYQINCKAGENYIDLPDYFKHLNTDSLVWANSFKHFGRAWGEVVEDGARAKIVCEDAGIYNILVFGDRKDKDAMEEFDKFGIEYEVSNAKCYNGRTPK